MDALQLSTTDALAPLPEQQKESEQRLLRICEGRVTFEQIANRVADARVNGVDDPVTWMLARPMCTLTRGPERGDAVLLLAYVMGWACQISGVSKQPSDDELATWAQQIVSHPDWSSLPIAAIGDFARQLSTGRWTLYDRLTMAQVGEYLRQYAAEWRVKYMAQERALHEAKLVEQQRAKAEQAKAEYEAMMADPVRRAEHEAERARLEAEMARAAEADAKRMRLLTPEQRARVAAEAENFRAIP